jgi:predicted Rossmann fold nucleotide-binding protein DprA/Smf involved in DNA uptake
MLAALDAGGHAIGVVADALEKAIRRQDLRAHIAEGQLTLISPCHPQARFTVANAMRRNRLIYTLAEAAFVVASGSSGGTFTGATEALKAGWLPLYVAAESAASGNRGLITAGAIPLHRGEIEEFDLLARVAQTPPVEQLAVDWEMVELAAEPSVEIASTIESADGEVAGVAPELGDVAAAPVGDLFEVVWPLLASFLRTPRSERDVATQFVIELTQARAWLKRAVGERLVETLKRPTRYQLIDMRRLSLLDSDAARADRNTREG